MLPEMVSGSIAGVVFRGDFWILEAIAGAFASFVRRRFSSAFQKVLVGFVVYLFGDYLWLVRLMR
jgi:hypothetical protein